MPEEASCPTANLVAPSVTLTLATLVAPLSWGTTYLTVTELLPAGRPLLIALLRVAPAGVLLAVVGLARTRWWPTAQQWRHLVLLALFNFGLFFPLLVVAIQRLPGGVAAAAGGVQPLLVGLLTWIVTGRRVAPVEAAVGLIAAIGVGFVVVRPGAGIDAVGVVAALGANLAFASGVVATKRLPPPPDRIAATGWQLLIATAIIAPVALLVEGSPPALSASNVIGFGYLSLLATAGSFLLWFRGISRLPTAAPPLLGLAAPVTGASLGWLVLGESLSVLQLMGFALTVGSITCGALIGAGRHPVAALGLPLWLRPGSAAAGLRCR